MRLTDLVVPTPPARQAGDERTAAVLIALTREDDPRIILTKRSADLLHHAGQMSLPGGAIDPGETPVDAAVREAQEEVGIDPSDIDVIGAMAGFAPARNRTITPVLAWVDPGVQPYPASPAEVAEVFMPRLSELVSAKVRRLATMSDVGYSGPAFVLGGSFVWGLTGHLLDSFLERAGLAREWDRAVTAEVPDEYRSSRRWADDD